MLLKPVAARSLEATVTKDWTQSTRRTADLLSQIDAPSSVQILAVEPQIDCGRYAAKREIGDVLRVTADIFKDGHDKIAAMLNVRHRDDDAWHETEMELVENDRWAGEFALPKIGRWEYTIEAFPDRFATWLDEISKKVGAGLDVGLEIREGRLLIEEAASRATVDRARFELRLRELESVAGLQSAELEIMLSADMVGLMRRHRTRRGSATLDQPLRVIVDRDRARYAAWYELFPRSMGRVPNMSGTFDDVISRLPAIQAMGFDVLYFTPIHPIGTTNRKGRNNTLNPTSDDPGVPYAIGGELGGHDAIEPGLGTTEDFTRLVAAAAEHGMEIALDLAINASPDHPWPKEHPEWFHIRPDGSIRFSENPPKKYEDIYPVNFDSRDWKALWLELKRVVTFWVDLGVKTFRVDNPHTKPIIFWEWLIDEIHEQHPDVIFLSEAFTRPKVMKALAKSGFAQSYTYFTWRNFKQELTDYFTELTQTDVVEYMRGNLFPNTHDILPYVLQQGGRPAFKMRLALATTLSSLYGIYSGYELCENTPVPGKEEYLNSEKYEFKVWDWDRPGNIIDYVTLLNRIRREHPALQEYDNLRFHAADDPNFLCYGKSTADGSDNIVVVVNLDPFQPHETLFHVPASQFGWRDGEPMLVTELITGQTFFWNNETQHVYLDPTWEPALIYSIKRLAPVDYVDVSGGQ
jgi:starch synthase (maltosyl-transferring)